MDGSKKKQVGRVLAGLLGLCLGVWGYHFWLDGPGRTPEEHLQEVVTRLPAELRERGQEMLGEGETTEEGVLQASGIIQAEQVEIASEFGGRIASLPVQEGEQVAAGELLVQLDTTLLDAKIEAAEALVAVAEAGLAQVQAGARPGQIAVAEAQLEQAEIGRLAAQQAVSDTLVLVENPQDIRLQIAVAQAQAQSAQYQVAQATTLKDAAEIAKNAFEDAQNMGDKVLASSGSIDKLLDRVPAEIRDLLPDPPGIANGTYSYGGWELHIHDGSYELYKKISLPYEFHLTPNNWWKAWVGVNAAAAQQQGAQNLLYHLYQQLESPQTIQAQADEALSMLAQAEAQVAAAEALVAGLRAGATPEQIAALEARLAQAQTAVEALQSQRDLLQIKAPLDGTVVSLAAYPGEVAAQGATLLTVADLDELMLTVYVPETQIGQIKLDQTVQVRVDSFPGRVFEGQVAHISNQAEFTPRNVATQEERVNLVFAVEIRVSNQDGALKPGMPADVIFSE